MSKGVLQKLTYARIGSLIPIIMSWHQYHRIHKRGSLKMSILSVASCVQVYFHAIVPIVFQTRSSSYASIVQMGLQNRDQLLPMKQIALKSRVVLLYCCLRLLSPSFHIQKFNFHSEKQFITYSYSKIPDILACTNLY